MSTEASTSKRTARWRDWAALSRGVLVVPLVSAAALALSAQPAAAATVSDEGDLRGRFLDGFETEITLDADIMLTNCALGSLQRNSGTDLLIAGNGHVITQTCAGARVMTSTGSGALTLVDVTVTGGQTAASAGGAFAVGDVSLDAATFASNSAGLAGALFSGGSIEMTNSTFFDNSSGANAGALQADGPVNVTDSIFEGNSSGSFGGAIASNDLTIRSSQFLNNTADAGGALVGNGTLDVTDSTFTGNSATDGEGGAIRGGPGSTVIVNGGEFSANSTSVNGGAIYAQATSTLSVTGATFDANQAPDGDGGALAAEDAFTVTGSVLAGNDAGELGGAIRAGSTVSIIGSELSDNNGAGAGGAVYAAGNVTVEGSTLSGNVVDASGGGAIQSGSGFVGVTDSVLRGNSASVGGAVWAPIGDVFAVRSTLADNDATSGSGGAISAGGSVSIEDSTLAGNSAGTNGGAIRAGEAGSTTLTNSTVTGNDAAGDGGGIWADASVDLRHVTLTGNQAAGGGNLYIANPAATLTAFGSVLAESSPDNCVVAIGQTSSSGYNVADDASCGLSDTSDEQAVGDLQLGTLADNGGPTSTRLPAATSPLVDAIPSGDCDAAVEVDQRGIDRPQGDGCDVGAVEASPQPESEPDSDGGSDSEGGADVGNGADAEGSAQDADADSDAAGSDAGSDVTPGAANEIEDGELVSNDGGTSPGTGTSVLPFLVAAAVLLAAGLTILFIAWRQKRRDETPARRRPDPPTIELSRIGQ